MSTEKSLGRILYENDPVQFVPWVERTQAVQESYEEQALVVAAAVREQVAAWLELQRNDVPATGAEFAAAVRWWSKNGQAGNEADPLRDRSESPAPAQGYRER